MKMTPTAFAPIKNWRFIFEKHFPPIVLGLFVAYATLQLVSDREIETISALAITPNPVRAGHEATIVFQGRQVHNCDGIVHRWVVGSTGTLIQLDDVPTAHHEVAPGRVFTFTKTFTVPLGFTHGLAEYHSEARRWCNVFQQYLWPVTDHYAVYFEISK